MINRVILVGRLTKDIEMRKTQSGASVVSFTLACDRRFKQQGQPDADFINCVAWNKTAELMSQYLGKGALIGVEGRINTRNYEDKDGRRVYVTEVVAETVQFLESRKDRQSNSYADQNNYGQPVSDPSGYQADESSSKSDDDFSDGSLDIASDDLPF